MSTVEFLPKFVYLEPLQWHGIVGQGFNVKQIVLTTLMIVLMKTCLCNKPIDWVTTQIILSLRFTHFSPRRLPSPWIQQNPYG